MSKISPSLRAMLAPPHPPAQTITDTSHIRRVFQRREQEATEHGLSRTSWLALMTATVIAMGFEPSMTTLYHYATASIEIEDSVAVAELMREIGMKGIAVVSVPQIMNMLVAFRASLPLSIGSLLSTTPSCCADVESIESINKQGEQLWNGIHYPKGSLIESRLANAHPDLANYVKGHVYGGLLARYRSPTVGRVTLSLCAIACLRASWKTSPQLLSHLHGLKKAWKDGSWRSEPTSGSEEGIRWLASDDGCIWVLETVDELALAIESCRKGSRTMRVARL